MQAHAQFDEYGNLHEEDLRGQLAEHVAPRRREQEGPARGRRRPPTGAAEE